MKRKACTTVLVGKKASIDGSTIAARNDDTYLPLAPHRFYMAPAVSGRHESLTSSQNGFTAPLPSSGYRHTAVPNIDPEKEGIYDESGINEKNVAMSATESVYGNEKALAYDPLVKTGLAEDAMTTMVLPFIESARDGVEYLGRLIAKYGSPEGNGVIFSDKNDVWYMEIVTGHHWAAVRIPDDAYAVAANQVAIQQLDFDNPDDYMWSPGIREFVIKHHLNPDIEGWNFRHIFGTSTEKDRHYNTPRVWFAQRYLNPETHQNPESNELPFICRASRRIAPEDVGFILSSHYNETPFDPLGNGDPADRLRYRPIAMNRTQNSHILQIRSDVPDEYAALFWLNFGVPAFCPYVPFYSNATDTDPSYSKTSETMNLSEAYWMYRALSSVVEGHYTDFIQDDIDYVTASWQALRLRLETADRKAAKLNGKELTAFLTEQNHETVAVMKKRTMALFYQLLSKGLTLSKLTYNFDKNL
ncbi:MAG: C69 family dipeptidase [Sporolactobacillus sp.]|jgi:dipeptidase|nr:C69 family dipeptidase [Sporolactobacillus sp.]MCI1881652.1 C69 family dipeptidase [Sporolactobacillus sp.]